MKFEKIHNKGKAHLFRNQYLERLTKTHPLVIWGMYTPLIVFMLYYSHARAGYPWWAVAGIFATGVLFWTLFEYIMHRFIFHFVSQRPRARRVIYVLHGNHHEFPRDRERLFMPPAPSLILAGLVFLALYLVVGHAAFAFFPGFLLGYLCYGSMHYAIHAWNPPFAWMKPLWRNHHLHHYKDEERGFGVSTSFWDRVFGTMFEDAPPPKSAGPQTPFGAAPKATVRSSPARSPLPYRS